MLRLYIITHINAGFAGIHDWYSIISLYASLIRKLVNPRDTCPVCIEHRKSFVFPGGEILLRVERTFLLRHKDREFQRLRGSRLIYRKSRDYILVPLKIIFLSFDFRKYA